MLKSVAIALFAAAAVTGQATWKDCGKPGGHGKISKIDIVPSQPVKGSEFSINGEGTIDEQITSGKYTMSIHLNNIPVFSHTGDGCSPETVKLPLGMGTVDYGGLKCPTGPGAVDIGLKVTVGKLAPNGKYSATTTAVDSAGNQVLCAEVDFAFSAEEIEAAQKNDKPLTLNFRKDWLVENNATNGHYGDPKNGCESDEQAVQVQGVTGDFCSPKCTGSTCPTDIPAGVTAKPQCALQTPTGGKYCALICSPSLPITNQRVADAQCGTNASCKPISGVGLCTYDD